MKIKIEEITKTANTIFTQLGFSADETKYIIENCLEGELTDKKSHGFNRLFYYQRQIENKKISMGDGEIAIEKETSVSLLVNGKNKTGIYVVNKTLELALEKVKDSKILIAGCTNTAPISGLIGQYARKATDNNLIFIGFNNSPAQTSGVIPHGSIKRMLGTNPITVGIPTKNLPIILDMASSKTTVGDILNAKREERHIEKGTLIDKKGIPSTSPEDAMDSSLLGGILPIAGHKGSGLAMIVEILAGSLTNSKIGNNVKGGWGSLFILIDPTIMRPLDEFKSDIEIFINELKTSPKMKEIKEIYYPGERSQKIRQKYIDTGMIEINDKLYNDLIQLEKELI